MQIDLSFLIRSALVAHAWLYIHFIRIYVMAWGVFD